jgi:hypothetical protein
MSLGYRDVLNTWSIGFVETIWQNSNKGRVHSITLASSGLLASSALESCNYAPRHAHCSQC